MSAADYYGTASYPQQHSYTGPPQKSYVSGGQMAPYNAHHAPTGYAPPGQPQYGAAAPHAHGQQEEKGLVATVVGGGAGGALAHKVGKGSKFKTMLGAAGGAVVANAIEHRLQGKKPAKHGKHGHHQQHHHQPQHYSHGAGGYGQLPHHGGGRPSNGGLMSGVSGLLGSGSHHGASNSGNGGLMGSMGGLLGGGKHSHGQQHHGHHGHGRW